MISVVIPLYNKEKEIGNALDSVLRQSYNDFEIIVVDDGSTDNSLKVIRNYENPKLRIVTQTNCGVSSARNKGAELATGEFVTFLDADDQWEEKYLETQHHLSVEYPGCEVFVTNYKFRHPSGHISNTILKKLNFDCEHGIISNYFEVAACSHPPITAISVMVRRKAFEAVGGFPVGIKSGEDLLTWARLACRYKIAFSTKPRAIYNLGPGYDFSNLPPRRQDSGDPVGTALKELLRENPKTAGLRKYISHWHKMRASVAIRYGERLETLREGLRCLLFNPLNYKVIPIMLLSFAPANIRFAIISNHKSK